MTRNQQRARELAQQVLAGTVKTEELSDQDFALLVLAAMPVNGNHPLPFICSCVISSYVSGSGYYSATPAGNLACQFPHSPVPQNIPEEQRPKVLIVDDHEMMRGVLSQVIRLAGYSPVCVSSGAQALDMVPQVNPCLIIVDWMMPGMDGIKLIRHLQSQEATRHLPVVVCSCRSTPEDMAAARSAGASDYWVKGNFDHLEAANRIARLLPRRQFEEATGDPYYG